jgi:hypothetical protein
MTGKLIYLEPAEELGYEGGWIIKLNDGKSYNNIFTICDESKEWIENNDPSKEMDVDFTVLCDCHYNEETNTAKHKLVARLNVV